MIGIMSSPDKYKSDGIASTCYCAIQSSKVLWTIKSSNLHKPSKMRFAMIILAFAATFVAAGCPGGDGGTCCPDGQFSVCDGWQFKELEKVLQQKKLTLNSARTVLAHVSVCLADKNVTSTAGTWTLTLANTWTEAKNFFSWAAYGYNSHWREKEKTEEHNAAVVWKMVESVWYK
jgi:hypothetical protein